MGISSVEFRSVSFHYPEQSVDVFTDLDLSFSPGWTAVIGANGGGKSTLLKLACGLLQPLTGGISHPEHAIYVPQRTEEIPPGYEQFASSYDAQACILHGKLNLERDYAERWNHLSHGERKRAQIAWALYRDGDLLCIDEPTNHLDYNTMTLILQALSSYNGIALLVSHDLEVLDVLCSATVQVQAPYVTKLGCSPSEALEQLRLQRHSIEEVYQAQRKQKKRLSIEQSRRVAKAASVDRQNTKRLLDPKDHDAKARIDGLRLTGADRKAGDLSRQLANRIERTSQTAAATYATLKQARALDFTKSGGGITVHGRMYPAKYVLTLKQARLQLAFDRCLFVPDLAVGNTDRVGITGPNGTGKSTLLDHLVRQLEATSIRYWYLGQELDSEQSLKAYKQFQALDEAAKARIVSTLVRLGSDANLFLASALPSPGELRKLLIAQALESELSLIILDEPTNHLDLPSRLALKQELSRFRGALLLVSHDRAFLQELVETHWELSFVTGTGDSTLITK